MTPKSFLVLLSSQSTPHIPRGYYHSNFFPPSVSFVYSRLLCKWNHIVRTLVSVWLLSPSEMFLSFICVGAFVSGLFLSLLGASVVWPDHRWFIRSSVDGHLDSFQYLPVNE